MFVASITSFRHFLQKLQLEKIANIALENGQATKPHIGNSTILYIVVSFYQQLSSS